MFIVRTATIQDLEELYDIGLNTPELQVSSTEPFMAKDEFAWSIQNENSIFLLAEITTTKKIAGFIYADTVDKNKPVVAKYACIVYLAVLPQFRKQGIAQKLFHKCQEKLKKAGITNLCCWAKNDIKSPIVQFMKQQGFKPGNNYIWMDKKLE